MEPNKKSGYRKVFADEFARRVEKNRKYSMRAFARDLGTSPSQLTRILNGTRNLSLSIARKIVKKLFSDKTAQASFIELVELETLAAKDGAEISDRIQSLASVRHDVHRIDLRTMKKLDSWSHFAIMDLLTLKEPPRDIPGIAKYLGVSEKLAREKIARLIEVGLLVESEQGLRKKHEFVSYDGGLPQVSVRSYHRQMIERGLAALAEQEVSRRYFSGDSIAIRRSLYPELIELTEDYVRRVSALARISSGDADALYQVNVQVFDHQRGEA